MTLAPPAAGHDGDINIDGNLDIIDLLWGQQALQGIRTLAPEHEQAGDVAPLRYGVPQPDGIFDLGDLVVIQRLALGLLNFTAPGNLFNIGDSIGEGEAADGTIGEPHHETVWSTGYKGGDGVSAFNERFEAAASGSYHENSISRDPLFNHAESGAEMADFAAQAQAVVAAAAQAPGGTAGMITVLLGSNDVCADANTDMTDPGLFEAQYRAGLEILAANAATRYAQLHVSGIPAIYWLWNAKREVPWCLIFAWPRVPCQNLLASPGDDCESSTSRLDPDTVYPGDGANCRRRKEFHALIRDPYNRILRDVLEEYRSAGDLPNASYTDIYDVPFEALHINGGSFSGDCFHPSTAGHARLADREWCRSRWGYSADGCPD